MSEPFTILSVDDICRLAADANRECRARRQWGNWHLEVGTLELVYRDGDRAFYRVDLVRCTTSAQVLDWIFQLRAKAWTSVTDIGHLIDALHDILDPQANLCSMAISKKLDAKTHLRRRYEGGC